MKIAWRTGLSFGLTSGIITTLGLIVGLNAGTHSKLAVVGGILTIAVADAFSDALGIHVSQESQDHHSSQSIWEATLATFLSKFIFTLTFIIPVTVFDLALAIWISVGWGMSLLAVFSLFIAKQQNNRHPWRAAAEHLLIGLVVILATYFIGSWIASVFA